MKLYKLTDQNAQTYNHTQWGEGVTHTASGEGDLCGHGWIHAYTDPLLAVLLNPIHANFSSPKLWEAEGEVGKTDHGLKVGCTSLTTTREVPLPEITAEQRVRFAILCAKRVCSNPQWNSWADDWISGHDRSAKRAAEVTAQAKAATWAELAAARAARAARAAWVAAWSSELAAARAARVAAWAAWTAARAAKIDLDLVAIAQAAVTKATKDERSDVCTCPCHTTPGMMHIVPCCGPGSVTGKVPPTRKEG